MLHYLTPKMLLLRNSTFVHPLSFAAWLVFFIAIIGSFGPVSTITTTDAFQQQQIEGNIDPELPLKYRAKYEQQRAAQQKNNTQDGKEEERQQDQDQQQQQQQMQQQPQNGTQELNNKAGGGAATSLITL